MRSLPSMKRSAGRLPKTRVAIPDVREQPTERETTGWGNPDFLPQHGH